MTPGAAGGSSRALPSLYLLGPPGIGKSAVLDGVLGALGWQRAAEPMGLPGGGGLLRGHALHRYAQPTEPTADNSGYYLGRARDGFPGTDALSLAVHPEALEWARTAQAPAERVIYGEGARLGTASFLAALAARRPLVVVLLTASPDTIEARCARRGSAQSAAWRKGAGTRATLAAHRAAAAGCVVMTVSAEAVLPVVVGAVLEAASAALER